ncbi:hypothetical protein C8Q77DRAFT_1175724, partial [Trametes polyzona]
MSTAVVASLVAATVVLLMSYLRNDRKASTNAPVTRPPRSAYILENTVTHARLLPAPSAHAFAYPTLAFLLALDALESGALDVGAGWLFGYGGTVGRLTGLRSAAYLLPDCDPSLRAWKAHERTTKGPGPTIKAKLAAVLVRQGKDAAQVRAWVEAGDAWMLTMPSYVGYEGINPLTVYFCFDARGEDARLAWVVLEIHNTFGEKHVHVLEPGTNEDADCPPGTCCRFDHVWTFPRAFHVSPFNDRLGFYTIAVSAPPPPLSPLLASAPPRPKIRIHLRTPAPSDPSVPGELKLTATFFARRAVPLTAASLLHALARYPFALLLSFARILYHAWILHYVKRLDVFPRPDPKPATPGFLPSSSDDSTTERVYGGVGWQPEGALEAYSRQLVERFLARRSEELGLTIDLISGDPSVPRHVFAPSGGNAHDEEDTLTIHYAAPRFFSTLLLAPSPEHMLLVGRTEDLFRASSDSLFAQVFSPTPSSSTRSFTQRVRTSLLPSTFMTISHSPLPGKHPLDRDRPLMNVLVICTMHLLDHLEKTIFGLLRARFVPGLEPWRRWERAA